MSVTVRRSRAVGPIKVFLYRVEPAPAELPATLVGFVGAGGWSADIKGLFCRNRMRFPRSAGYEVEPGVAYQLLIEARDAAGPIPCPIDGIYVFARGAIIDLFVTL